MFLLRRDALNAPVEERRESGDTNGGTSITSTSQEDFLSIKVFLRAPDELFTLKREEP
jgi:hypothetical protein